MENQQPTITSSSTMQNEWIVKRFVVWDIKKILKERKNKKKKNN